jgi:hypothetical protein
MSGKVIHTHSQAFQTYASIMRAIQTYASIASDVQSQVSCNRGGGGRAARGGDYIYWINQPPKKCANGDLTSWLNLVRVGHEQSS